MWIIALLTSINNDGEEVKHLSGIAGVMNDRIDYLTTLSKNLTFVQRQYIPHRHYSTQLTQSVQFHKYANI